MRSYILKSNKPLYSHNIIHILRPRQISLKPRQRANQQNRFHSVLAHPWVQHNMSAKEKVDCKLRYMIWKTYSIVCNYSSSSCKIILGMPSFIGNLRPVSGQTRWPSMTWTSNKTVCKLASRDSSSKFSGYCGGIVGKSGTFVVRFAEAWKIAA